MKYKILIFTVISILSLTIQAKQSTLVVTKEQCKDVQGDIEKVRKRMRQAYGVAEGNRLNEKLRVLEKVKYACRKKRLPTK